MEFKLLHIFRNAPFGRETLLQSIYFCQQLRIPLDAYIPKDKRFLMYFEHGAVQVALDDSYFRNPDRAHERFREIAEGSGVRAEILGPLEYTASGLPDLPTNYAFMTCPRSMSERVVKMTLSTLGRSVRGILKAAQFPVLIPSPVFKPWRSIAVLFGGSINAFKALRLGLRISRDSGLPLDVFTQGAPGVREELTALLEERGLATAMAEQVRRWVIFESGDLADNLMAMPHDCVIVLGAYGHGLIKDFKASLFGSTMELVQSTMPNNLLVVGPAYMSDDPELNG